MRIVIDLQACQSASARRGIGRYSFALAQAIAHAAGAHEVWLALNSAFPESVESIRHAFAGIVPKERTAVFAIPMPTAMLNESNAWRSRIGESIREAFLASLSPDVVHIGSLFEGLVDDAVTSMGMFPSTHATAVTLYDFIPRARDDVLPTPSSRDWYKRKLESLARADIVFAISEHTRKEAIAALQVPADRLAVVPPAPDSCFQPLGLRADQVAAIRRQFGIERPFVMCAGGFDKRKNIPGLVSAFAQLPNALRTAHQLVLVGDADPVERASIARLCRRSGLAESDVLLTGYLNDDTLAALYGSCTLFVFPSFHEGFGLPALEAMACGAAVIASDATGIPEAIGRSDALFAPDRVDAIAAKMHEVLTDESFRTELKAHGLRRSAQCSWTASARRALDAMETASESRKHATISRAEAPAARPKLAYVSPLPPERTGIASYSAELLPYLGRHYDIDLVADQAHVSLQGDPASLPVRSIEWFEANADRYDRVLYHIGNSPAHQRMFGLLEACPGTVVLHDFFLGGVLNWMDESWTAPGIFSERLFESHGYAALIADSVHGRDETIDRFPCNSRIVDHANGVIVHSEQALKLASEWYGDIADQWCRIPQLRRLPNQGGRDAARRALRIDDDAFLLCSFGFIHPAKLNHRLLDAWLAARFASEPIHHLVFVGENHGGDYGRTLAQKVRDANADGRVRITGFVDDDIYRLYLEAADAAVQLRGISRGETPRTALDCLAYGLPLICNGGEWLAELPDRVSIRVAPKFEDRELTQTLERLAADADLRANLAEAGRRHIECAHDPGRVAARFRTEIERFASEGRRQRYRRLVKSIVAERAAPSPRREDWLATAESVAFDFPPSRVPQLLVDVSVLEKQDLKTGIERVVREVLARLLKYPPSDFRVEPVVARGGEYVCARRFTCRWLGIAADGIHDSPIDIRRGDCFLGLDWAADIVPQCEDAIARYRALGVDIAFVVYDLLPLRFPTYYPAMIEQMHNTWLTSIATVADGLVCISRSVEQELAEWLDMQGPARRSPLRIGSFHPGADVERTVHSGGESKGESELVERMARVPAALIVGTVEPRKGHRQALAAFESLWRDGVDIDLVFIGKKGWMVDDLASALHSHPQAGQRLFWLEQASDQTLERVYRHARVLIAPSMGEGFGLPLVEAARHGVPIVARDLPVFREVAGEHAFYFRGTAPEDLADAMTAWLGLHAQGQHPKSNRLPRNSWDESTDELLEVLRGRWNRTWSRRAERRQDFVASVAREGAPASGALAQQVVALNDRK